MHASLGFLVYNNHPCFLSHNVGVGWLLTINSRLPCIIVLVVVVACSSFHHDSVMDSTAKAEPKLLAQLENLESQYNPDFDLGFDEWLASQNTEVFEEQLNSLSAEENGISVMKGFNLHQRSDSFCFHSKRSATH